MKRCKGGTCLEEGNVVLDEKAKNRYRGGRFLHPLLHIAILTQQEYGSKDYCYIVHRHLVLRMLRHLVK